MHNHHHSQVNDAHSEILGDGPGAVMVKLLTNLRHLPPSMHSVLIVMALTWVSWFPFFLFGTDWMGREVYHGDPKGDSSEVDLYNQGVREGAFGLLLNSVVLSITSFFIEPMCRRVGTRLVWAISNFMVFVCMAATAIISLVSINKNSQGIQHVIGGNRAIEVAALVVFSLLGVPLAITYSVPFSVTAELTADSGGGQGLAIGVLNLATVVPQMIVSLGSGPWDALFGGGNIPAFVLASVIRCRSHCNSQADGSQQLQVLRVSFRLNCLNTPFHTTDVLPSWKFVTILQKASCASPHTKLCSFSSHCQEVDNPIGESYRCY